MIEENLLEDFLHQELQSAIDALEDDEAKVLCLRYGIDDLIFKTVAEVAQILNLTPKMVEKIERKALRKLRHPGRSQLLRAYLN
ncbi:MAG: sigma factor-like helix-turn-helix DNA-binding protein [Prochloraceae cyanobacterium]|nr:sigma factor-like helix-turn-helix DNA-binding protein [Prochloraceae cyanobacterium]